MTPFDALMAGLIGGLLIFVFSAVITVIRAIWQALTVKNIGRVAGSIERRTKAAIHDFRSGRNDLS